MKTIRLLYLCAQQMSAYRWQSGELIGEGIFAANTDGHQQFADYLTQHQASVFTILANVAEEGFQIETIPFLRGADRQAIIERKLGQLFFNAALTASLSLGYEKNTRKNEHVMLAALNNKAIFSPWLSAIGTLRIALSGIYSLPLLAPSLLRKFGIAGDQCLLLTVHGQSIRQSYIEKGELHFSRLSPLPNSSLSDVAQAFSNEAQKLQHYLASQRIIGRQQSITANILAPSEMLTAARQSCADSATIHFNIIDVDDCARKTGLGSAPTESQGEQIFLKLLLSDPPRTQFADDFLRHDHHLRQVRFALHGLGAATLFCGLLFCATLLYETHVARGQAQALKSEAEQARQRYQEIARSFPPLPSDHESLRRIIDRYLALEKTNVSPDGLYREISRALDAAQSAELVSIDWQAGRLDASDARRNDAAGAGQESAAIPVISDNETAIVRGTLKLGTNASARQINNAFNDLLEALKANPGLQIVVLQRPFEIESAKSLKGGDSTTEDHTPRSFAVQVIRKSGS
jgi:hypothetical protein